MRKYKTFNNKLYEKHLLCQLRIMVSPFEPEFGRLICDKIQEWLEGEVGQWATKHCREISKEEYKHYDPACDKIVNCVKIEGYLSPEHWSFFILKWS